MKIATVVILEGLRELLRERGMRAIPAVDQGAGAEAIELFVLIHKVIAE